MLQIIRKSYYQGKSMMFLSLRQNLGKQVLHINHSCVGQQDYMGDLFYLYTLLQFQCPIKNMLLNLIHLFIFLKQVVIMKLRMVWNSRPSFLSFLPAGLTAKSHNICHDTSTFLLTCTFIYSFPLQTSHHKKKVTFQLLITKGEACFHSRNIRKRSATSDLLM